MVNKPEVLAPAGDMERLIMAVNYGADAVYLAGKNFGMRAFAGNFSEDELIEARRLCSSRSVKMYITCNSVLKNNQIKVLPQFLEAVQDIGADAVIVTDIGVLNMSKKYAPKLDVHISTQCGITNYETANAFYDMGASRVILARELSMEDIREIREKTPKDLEIETFVHGAMCVSFSGRCLLSNYMTGRDANNGACAQPCRWKYHLVEEKRPGEYFEITEDGGTYILNSRDLCMIDHIPELIDAGVSSFKIEGRMKSFYYAAAATNAYRHAVDAALKGEPLAEVWRQEVMKLSHRPYSTGFYYSDEGPGQHYNHASYETLCDIVAQVDECSEAGFAELTQRNKFLLGDVLELITPNREPLSFKVDFLQNGDGEDIESAPHPMMKLRMKLPINAPKYSLLRKYKEQNENPKS